MTSFLTLVNSVLERTGQEAVSTLNNAVSPTNQAMAFINDVVVEMVTLIAPGFLTLRATWSTQSQTALYTFPAQTDATRLLKDQIYNTTTGNRLYEVDPAILHARDLSTEGAPIRFWFEEDKIRFYPIPDGVYNIAYRYVLLPSTLFQDTDTLAFPVDWQLVLIRGAQSLMEKFLGDADNGRTSYLMYLEGLMLLKTRQRSHIRRRMHGYYAYPNPSHWNDTP